MLLLVGCGCLLLWLLVGGATACLSFLGGGATLVTGVMGVCDGWADSALTRLKKGLPSNATGVLVLVAVLRFFSAAGCCFCLAMVTTADADGGGGAVVTADTVDERNGLALFAIEA